MGNPEDPAVAGTDKAFHPDESSLGGAEATHDEEREGVEATDTEAQSPHGVGESSRRGAEEIADDESTQGTQGPSGRPYGQAEPGGSTGVNKQGSVTEGPDTA
jgi:hypothetical protein